MVVSCKIRDDSNEKVSYNTYYAIIKCELIKISNLHNYDLTRIIFSIFHSQKPSMPILIALL